MTKPTRWCVALPDEVAERLEEALRAYDDAVRASRHAADGAMLELLVDRYRGLRIEVRANEHPPPHFHVVCAAGEASFRLSDGLMIDGNLSREMRVIREWYDENRLRVISKWNDSRPSDCPVGVYRDE